MHTIEPVESQVSEGSVAEELGIKAGDIIKRWNRKKISTTVEVYVSVFIVSVYPIIMNNNNMPFSRK